MTSTRRPDRHGEGAKRPPTRQAVAVAAGGANLDERLQGLGVARLGELEQAEDADGKEARVEELARARLGRDTSEQLLELRTARQQRRSCVLVLTTPHTMHTSHERRGKHGPLPQGDEGSGAKGESIASHASQL